MAQESWLWLKVQICQICNTYFVTFSCGYVSWLLSLFMSRSPDAQTPEQRIQKEKKDARGVMARMMTTVTKGMTTAALTPVMTRRNGESGDKIDKKDMVLRGQAKESKIQMEIGAGLEERVVAEEDLWRKEVFCKLYGGLN